MLMSAVNAILGDHNVDKQMTDSRGEVFEFMSHHRKSLMLNQVAYLMADISDVNVTVIKDLYQSLESLSCMLG